MLFFTNRILEQSPRSRKGRRGSFDLNNTEAQQSVFFYRPGVVFCNLHSEADL
jgi:hypothetical protein